MIITLHKCDLCGREYKNGEKVTNSCRIAFKENEPEQYNDICKSCADKIQEIVDERKNEKTQ